MNKALTLFPFVKKTMDDLIDQSKMLNKVTLTGKINALDVAATLFEFTDTTTLLFNELQTELIDALLEENLNKLNNELTSKSQIAINILIRNLFQRTADVGFLATDKTIIDFLINDTIALETMQSRLVEYANKYTVYNEIVIFDTKGNAKVNLNPNNPIVHSSDKNLQLALSTDDYVEYYAHSDIFKSQEKTLIYLQKIVHNNSTVGVLCLCFKFEDELERIFKGLVTKHEMIAVADKNGLMASSNTRVKKSVKYNESYQYFSQTEIAVTTKTSGYQGYMGISDWYGIAVGSSKEVAVPLDQEEDTKKEKSINLLNQKLKDIIEKADDLVDDLGDVIINGELIAAKGRVYVLSPILDNLRIISTSLLETIQASVYNLEHLVKESLINDVKMSSHLAIDIMDRNLYERANDCRWWALTPLFQQELSTKEPDAKALNETLLYINDLYTVYTNLYLYDTQGKIIASSHDQSIIGKSVTKSYLSKVLNNNNTQNYFVSDFESSEFYEQKATYIYNATIRLDDKTVGGIGIVFDSEVEFQAILEDSFPSNKKGFSLFADANKKVIASTNSSIKILDTLDISDAFFVSNSTHAVHEFIPFNDKDYIVSSVPSLGYREYKTEDNYTNRVFALTFVEI
ncbi:MAG: cache domain-containing protein [Campylobacterota bacterium]|nr:cache domain-containing protein [Campylobacterota bacterium]